MEMDIYNTYSQKAYRFMSFKGLEETINNRSLRFTNVTSLNDPLDCSPLLYPIQYTSERLEILKNKAAVDILNTAVNSLFICCFSKEYDTHDSYLMWSHYAKEHTQLAIEIDFSKCNIVGNPSEVKYSQHLADLRNNLNINEDTKVGSFIATNKLTQWSYEKEVRLIIDRKHQNFNQLNAKIDSDHLFLKFDINSISKIIFGVNSERSDESRILNLLENLEVKPAFEKMFIDPKDLELKHQVYSQN